MDMRLEQRLSPRRNTMIEAYIFFDGGRQGMACIIRNLSAGGATPAGGREQRRRGARIFVQARAFYHQRAQFSQEIKILTAKAPCFWHLLLGYLQLDFGSRLVS